ncbi:NAD(P)H-binding protein [Yinghuangia seranimata]|uniref:NAD(P)H-binding protein n=1 Tax=Yinghuangia seranimata TaxID=408067 RepID=UPI00248AE6BA|nr:NAD(P)H-binding protein [Yinghuangia seranimata]MDI2126812.1 NAD(P)H-binding protein [Yinghuangia seranimata]
MTVLVTGARGAVARHLMRLLDERGIAYRAASATPSDTAVACNLNDPATFAAALDGVESVFLYANPTHIDAFLKEAAAAGVQHIVLLSSSAVLAPDASVNVMAKSHLDVETALVASPIRGTLLRPGSFASNAGAWAWSIRSGAPVSLPYPGAHNDPIHEADVAECALAVLTDPALAGRAYTLTGPESVDFTTQIATLARVTGTDIATAHVTRDAWKTAMADYIPAQYADALLDWWESNDGKPVDLTDSVAALTGHAPRDFATWAADHRADFTA